MKRLSRKRKLWIVEQFWNGKTVNYICCNILNKWDYDTWYDPMILEVEETIRKALKGEL